MTREMRDYVKGLILGRFSSPLPSTPAQREPVAYLYNGVRLPKLPEWEYDESVYKYLMIRKHKTLETVHWIVGSEKPIYVKSGIAYVEANRMLIRHASPNTEWYAPTVGHDASEYDAAKLVWANHDILNSDGSVYLAASEPVPVYE